MTTPAFLAVHQPGPAHRSDPTPEPLHRLNRRRIPTPNRLLNCTNTDLDKAQLPIRLLEDLGLSTRLSMVLTAMPTLPTITTLTSIHNKELQP